METENKCERSSTEIQPTETIGTTDFRFPSGIETKEETEWECEACGRDLADNEECYCGEGWQCDECGRDLADDEDCYCSGKWICDDCGRELEENEDCTCELE